MSLSSLKNLIISQKDKDYIFGYIRQHVNSTLCKEVTWPLSISHVILLFAHIDREKLSLRHRDHDNYVHINPAGDLFLVKKIATRWTTIWGSKLIRCNIPASYIWEFQVESSSFEAVSFIIGISNKKAPDLESRLINKSVTSARMMLPTWRDHYYYCISSDGKKYRKEDGARDDSVYTLSKWNDRTTVKMEMHCRDYDDFGKLKFYIDGEHQKYANFNFVKFKNKITDQNNVYTLCMSMVISSGINIHLTRFDEIVVE